jgi:lipid II:glycine glycyltransferase (peptidoglycan interpeptide bridge formation enzyme)
MRGRSYAAPSRLFFDKVLEGFGDNFKIVSVSLNNELVAATAFLCNQKTRTVHLPWGGYKELHGLSPNFYAIWMAIKWAHENGFRFANFGNTPSDETNKIHQFKEAFGGEFTPKYRFSIPLRPRMYALARRLSSGLRR